MDYNEKSGGLDDVVGRQRDRVEATRRSGLRQGEGGDLIIEASRENGYIKVSVYERSEGGEKTLRPYEHVDVPWEQIEARRREVISLLNRANRRAKVTREILESLKKSGQVLFDLLIPSKAREKLSSTEASNLILYVDDKLVHIPWELLFDGRQFLCRRFAMGRIVRTRQAPTALSSRRPKAPFKVLVVADPRGDLDASYREGTEIRNFLDEKRDIFHVDFKSHPVDVSFVKKNLRDYDIVHYAGHADYHSENPSESGWLLKDARLKASEISAMGGLQPMPSLVFSNACQSGHSGEWRIKEEDEQRIFGLANAYLLAGVQHYIGTFWEILDEPSSQFAKLFYGSLSEGESVGEAVRKAREKLIEAHGEETIVWASYMLYGDPTFAFDPAEKEEVEKPVVRDIASPEWSPVMRGHGAAATMAAKPRRSSLGSLLFGALLLCGGIAGYLYFFQPDDQHPPAVSALTAAIPDPTGTTKNEAVDSSKEAGLPESTGETNQEKSPDSARMKDPVSPNLLKSAAAKPTAVIPPVAAPQAPARPIEVQEAALKKDSPQPVVAAPLTLSMNIIGQRKEADGSYTEVLVSEGSVLRSYDNFQVHLETNRPAYVYILLYDSQGKASQLFPDPKIHHAGFLEQARRVVVPARDLWFWLDEHTGTETIYVLTSEKPMPDIQGLLAKMEAVDDDAGKKRVAQEIKQRIATVQRGVGGITKGQAVTYTLSDGKKIQKVTDVVTGTESVVRAVSFLHR